MALLAKLLRALLGLSSGHGSHPVPPPTPAGRIASFTTADNALSEPAKPPVLKGRCWVVDGDTIVIDRIHLRLHGIDAPELEHPWGRQAKSALIALCKGQVVTAILTGAVSHERSVAECFLPDGRDLSAEMVKAGLALDWKKHSGGRYRHLEAPDARKRFWRADARQKGRFPPAST